MPESSIEDSNEFENEVNIFSFMVRIWKEESDVEEHQVAWRGHITPVQDGNRHYFTDVSEIPAFIAAYLKERK